MAQWDDSEQTDPYMGDGGAPESQQPTGATPWWQQERPSYVPADRPWPPPLPPGASYGTNPGEIVYPPGYQTNGTDARVTDTTSGTQYNPYDLPSASGDQTAAAPTAGQGGGGAGAGGGSGYASQDFNFPTFTPPTYTPGPSFAPPNWTPPPAFSYADFKVPTLEEAQNQPGYQFALQEGQKALQNSAAAKGVLRTGGTLKDLFSWGDKFGEQNYGNVFNQDLQAYSTNRNNAADAYQTNYGVSRDAFDRAYGSSKDVYDRNNQAGLDAFDRLYQGSVAAFNPLYNSATLKFSDLYNRDRDKLNALTQLSQYPG